MNFFALSPAEMTQIYFIIGWGVLLVLSIIVEAYSVELVSIWFCLGSIVALILAILNVTPWVQILVFTLVSVISLIFGRLLLKKLLKKSTDLPTNSDALVGKTILIVTPVSKFKLGSGRIGDVVWTVAVHEDVNFNPGDECIIDAIEGNKIIVSRKEN
jgi:membrane protein implicated in regulation of membrane protease activity